jgi:hypothetical protein
VNKQHLTPVFNTNVEAHAMQALNAVMVIFQTAMRPIGPEGLVELDHAITKLVDCLFPIEGNNADLAGFAPLPAGHYVHPIKTAEAAALLGRATGMPRSKLILLATSASLMNVGYLLLKQSLIDEPRRLMDGEWEQQVHTHPALSITALTSSGLPHEAIVAIGQHHERWDGSGYPHAVRGEEICVEARILAIADTFISLRSERPYRAAMATEQALQVIASEAGRLYEPSLVDAFTDVIRTYGEKEERKATGGASTEAKAAEDASQASRDGRAGQPREEFAQPRREEDGPAADDASRASARAGVKFEPAARAIVRAPARVAPVRPNPVAPTRSALRSRRPARAGAAPRRGRRSLFSTGVYVRASMSGDWLG